MMEKAKPDHSNYKISLIAACFMAVFALVMSIIIVKTLPLTHESMILGPGAYPLMLGVGMLIASIFLTVQILTGRTEGVLMKHEIDFRNLGRPFKLYVLAVMAVAAIPLFGFMGSMFLFAFIELSFIEPQKVALVYRIIYSVAIPVIIFYLFKVLSISLPIPFWLQ
ncbi:MAG TPA: tripartite tricarboxylate transporter TctB family protein [Syntrophomonas sp.]|nr:tripartite tricarboxylate transporter TctB family protein [Syntrophomonas sp.]